jgi:hypothetical protein
VEISGGCASSRELIEIVLLSLRVSLPASSLAFIIGAPWAPGSTSAASAGAPD